MNEEQLLDEISLGDRARHAYESYVKEYIEQVNLNLFNEFSSSSVENIDRVLEIKRLQSAVKGLETSILQDIETGKLALISLEQLRK